MRLLKAGEAFPNFLPCNMYIYIYIFKGLNETTLPEGGINVFSALLHTHLAGKF